LVFLPDVTERAKLCPPLDLSQANFSARKNRSSSYA
jgi:hypothetical protein